MEREVVEELNGFLSRELSAVESYTEALAKVRDEHLAGVLDECRVSHAKRAERLKGTISEYGGDPIPSGGLWGKLGKAVVDASTSLGDKAIVTALEEGEDIGSNFYEWRLVQMHGQHRKLIKDELWPEQQATHKRLSEITNAFYKGVWPPHPDSRDV